MKLKSFADLSIQSKVMVAPLLVLVLGLAGSMIFYLPYIERTIIIEKEQGLHDLVDTVIALVAEYDSRYTKGELTLPDAQERVKARIKNIRYRQKEYFWINDAVLPFPTMVMHPTVPALDGKVLDAAKFNCATSLQNGFDGKIQYTDGKKNLFQSFVEVANSDKGEGFVTYAWPKPLVGGGTTKNTYPKMSYVKKFHPWGWVIGSGLYIDDVADEIATIKIQLLIAVLIFTGFALLVSLLVASRITKPLRIAAELTQQLSDGDLTAHIHVTSEDEVGRLLASMQVMVDHLKSMIERIKTAAEAVAVDSNQLSVSAEQMSRGVNEQAERATLIATSTEEMSLTVVDIAKNASQMSMAAEETTKIANQGGTIVGKSTKEVRAIADTVNASAQMVKSLGNRSQQIGEIVRVIRDVADQTNLLALNAAIEAARAGEHGRGFAVVANEVKTLSERTAKATFEISSMIQAIQQEVGQTVVSMDSGTRMVEVGVDYSKQAGNALTGIVRSIEGLTGSIHQIASSTEEMSVVSGTISTDIERIADVSRETSAGATQVAKSARQLARLAADMKEIVAQFRI